MAEKGETEEGISLLQKALTLDPDNAEAKSILNQLIAKKKLDIAKEKKLYKKMLGASKVAEKEAKSSSGEVSVCYCITDALERRREGWASGEDHIF